MDVSASVIGSTLRLTLEYRLDVQTNGINPTSSSGTDSSRAGTSGPNSPPSFQNRAAKLRRIRKDESEGDPRGAGVGVLVAELEFPGGVGSRTYNRHS